MADTRWKKGKSGNPNGRPKSQARELLEKAVEQAAKKYKKSLYEHALERAYEDDAVLVAVLRKLVPDLRGVDANLLIKEPFRLILSNGVKRADPGDTERGS